MFALLGRDVRLGLLFNAFIVYNIPVMAWNVLVKLKLNLTKNLVKLLVSNYFTKNV